MPLVRLYYIEQAGLDGKFPLKRLETETGRIIQPTLIDGTVRQGLTASADGSLVMFVLSKELESDLQLVEDFFP